MKGERQESEYHEIMPEKKHNFVVNHFMDEINSRLNKQYLGVTINKVFGQYVHTRMHMYHLTTHNGDKVTACLSIYEFQPKEVHGFVDYAHEGHMKPATVQKKLIEMDNWPSCGAFGRSSSCDQSQAKQTLDRHLQEINEKLQFNQQGYQIVRCWSQMVQGTNYFMHVVSNTGKKASVGMYVPFDDYDDDCQNIPENKKERAQQDEENEQLLFQITFCSKGHVNYE